MTPFFYACQENIELVELLIGGAEAIIQQPFRCEKTALHYAVQNGDYDIALLLESHFHFDVHAETSDGVCIQIFWLNWSWFFFSL